MVPCKKRDGLENRASAAVKCEEEIMRMLRFVEQRQSSPDRIADHLRIIALAPRRYSRRVDLADAFHQRDCHPQLERARRLAQRGGIRAARPPTPGSDGIDVDTGAFRYLSISEDAKVFVVFAQVMCHDAIIPWSCVFVKT